MKKILATIATTVSLLLFATPVLADSNITDFESFTLGTVDSQSDWKSLGSIGSGCALYDHAVDNSLGITGFGLKSLRISNAVTSGCFGDQTFATPLVDSVGEADATAAAFSEGTRQTHFEMEFDIASTMENQQPGLFVSVSPDRGDGSRMSYIGFSDESDGINMIFYDVQGTEDPANFVPTDLGTFTRSEPHHIKLAMDVVDGPSNDVVNIWIDGVHRHTGTSWENYYRNDSEASAEQSPRIVKTAIFRTGGSSAPGTNENGYLFDNISLSSGETPAPSQVTGMTIFQNGSEIGCDAYANNRSITVKWDASLDPLFDHYRYQADEDMASPYDFTTNVFTNKRSGTIRDEDGTYHYRVANVDTLGNVGEWSDWCGITLDRVAPVVHITSHTNGDVVHGNVEVKGSVEDDNPDHYYAILRNSSNSVVAGPGTVSRLDSFVDEHLFGFDSTSLPDGVYTIWLAARDAAGNRDDAAGSLDTVQIVINNTPDNKNQCKRGGWMEFDNPSFKNQGDCVSYVQSSPNAKGNKEK